MGFFKYQPKDYFSLQVFSDFVEKNLKQTMNMHAATEAEGSTT